MNFTNAATIISSKILMILVLMVMQYQLFLEKKFFQKKLLNTALSIAYGMNKAILDVFI